MTPKALQESIRALTDEELVRALAFHVEHIKALHEEVDRRVRELREKT